VVRIEIGLPDLTTEPMEIDRQTQATELLDTLISQLNLNTREGRELLSLWIVSPDLGNYVYTPYYTDKFFLID